MNILFWIFASLLDSISESYRKKSIDNLKMHNWLISLFRPLVWIFIIYFFIIIFWINYNIFFDKNVIILLFIAALIDWFWSLLEIKIIKNIKISKIMPYASFDKLFIILLWFILFYWNPGYTSITTLIISVLTVVIIMLFSIDLKNFWIEKDVKLYIFLKFLYACSTLIIWKVLFDYSTLDIFSLIIFFYLFFHIFTNLFFKRNFILIFSQNKQFYKYILTSTILWRSSFIIWIYIIESSWVLFASLLSFITIVFSIFSMKFILWDTPNKKQVLLSIIVILMIWIWYYFK